MKSHGKHRRTSPQTHGHSADRADQGSRGTYALTPRTTWTTFAEPQPPAIPYAGIRTGELIGHRLWWMIVEKDKQWLCSLAHRRLWLPGETIEGDLEKPVDIFCSIFGGTYAFSNRDFIEPELNEWKHSICTWNEQLKLGFIWVTGFHWFPLHESTTLVSGTVKMWGEVVEHERGYRSQFAKLHSLDAIYGSGDLDGLRRRYLPITND